MYLKKTKVAKGRTYLSICESYRDGAKTRTRTIEKCGYLDELQKTMDDPVAYYTNRAKTLAQSAGQRQRAIIYADEGEQISKDQAHAVWLGVLPPSKIYHLLELDRFWRIRNAGGNLPANLNSVFRMLVYMRILHPTSMMKTWERRDLLPDRCNFTQEQLCRSIEHLARFEIVYRTWINRHAAALFPSSNDKLYCGISNYYFKVDDNESSRTRKKAKPNPIVQEGLLLQGENAPIDYEVFIGEVSNTLTLLPVIQQMKGRHHNRRFVVVMDRGLSVTDNLKSILDNGDGFIFNQSVNQLLQVDRDWVLSKESYIRDAESDVYMKSRLVTRKLETFDNEGNLVVKNITMRQIACWDQSMAVRAQEQRAHILEKNQVAHGHVRRKLVRQGDAGKGNAHVLHQTNWHINWKKVEEEEKKDGYYCIFTSEIDEDPRQIRNAFIGLNRTEYAFRVVQSAYDDYPVKVARNDKIRAHFMVCYTALVILRILQNMVGNRYEAEDIAEELSKVRGYAEDANWYLFSYRSDLLDEVGEATEIDMTRKRLTRKQVKEMLAETKKQETQAPARRGGRRGGENLYPFPEISPKEIPEDAR